LACCSVTMRGLLRLMIVAQTFSRPLAVGSATIVSRDNEHARARAGLAKAAAAEAIETIPH